MLRFAIYLLASAALVIGFTLRFPIAPVSEIAPAPVELRTVFGQSPTDASPPISANLTLPEDAVLLPDGSVVLADTQAGLVKKMTGDSLAVVAGTGSMRVYWETLKGDTADKPFPTTAIEPYGNGFLSFSANAAGINYHEGDAVTYLGNSFQHQGEELVIGRVFYTQRADGGPIALDQTLDRNIFFQVTDGGLKEVEIEADLSGQDMLAFSFCGNDLIYAYEATSGGPVQFERLRNGGREHLFTERPYSTEIYCISDDDFLFGARWELKRYTAGELSVVADGFTHIAGIRPGRSSDEWLVTDSDAETVSLVTEAGVVDTIISTKGSPLADPLIRIQEVSPTEVWGITPHNGLVQVNPETGKVNWLLTDDGSGEWDALLKGHKFASLRAFALDATNGVVFLGSNHGIFRLDPSTGDFGIFAGVEDEYGFQEGPRASARFAVIRDLDVFDGRLYVADAWNDRIRSIDLSSGEVSTAVGSGNNEWEAPNEHNCAPRRSFNLNRPLAVAIDGRGIFIANSFSHTIVRASLLSGKACQFAGTPAPSGDQYGGGFADGPSGRGMMNGPSDIALAEGGILVADMWNGAVRFVDNLGAIRTLLWDPQNARMIAALAYKEGQVVFSGSDATVKSFHVN